MKKTALARSAGVLLHITSLPGSYSIGDFGPEAYRFVKQLKKSGQHYWQILPLNPLDSTKGYSPYSPLSAFAGNTLFINPEILLAKKLLKEYTPIKNYPKSGLADYSLAEYAKGKVLNDAYKFFRKNQPTKTTIQFIEFKEKEAYWLDDFALYITLRNQLKVPWYKWPKDLRDRLPEAIENAVAKYKEALECERYAQFLFFKQWRALKKYCNKQGVEIVGDIPIYISHDSADVWAHPEYFRLTAGKAIAKIAGVPPDYFNEKGQLWNMPVYNWKILEKEKYKWWIQRLQKNLELFDLVRLDHFRGFSSYWEVKGGSEDAIDGAWKKGPGEKLFNLIQKEFPSMPFIAEDLGDVNQAVYDLRDKYKLPGMRILQFAFEGDMPKSEFIPHNYTLNSVVYTGTHDNNTVRGWYTNEVSKKGKKNLQKYLSKSISKKNCHKVLIRETYKSVANVAIIPMQDILGLGEKERMNYPSTETGNWIWRMKKNAFGKKEISWLRELGEVYGRVLPK